MMTNKTRRTFLQQAALAAAAAGFAAPASLLGQPSPGTSKALAFLTDPQGKFQPLPFPEWSSQPAPSGEVIEIDTKTKFQSILGFGGALTDASCYLMSQMDAQPRRQFLAELYGPDGLGFSTGRTCIGSSDYSRNAYSFDDSPTPDPELKHFSIAHDQQYILPMLREALQTNPDLFLFSTPWSPPGWMKSGGSLLGGSMRKAYFAPYAQYFVKFLEAYQAEGVPIQAITTQNEVDTDQDSRMPACLWGQEYESGFIRDHLGPALQQAKLDTRIWILDHNYDLWGRAVDQLTDPAMAKFVDGVAWHGYVGSHNAMTRVHDAFPTKHTYWTEGGPDYTLPDYGTDWARWSADFTGILRNWARCIVCWNVLLDEKGAPNIGPFNCGGLLTLNSKTRQLSRSGMYWAFAHYSKLIRRGAQVIATTGAIPQVSHVAVTNPDGSQVLVLTNQGQPRDIHCRLAGKTLQTHLPADSILTLHWS